MSELILRIATEHFGGVWKMVRCLIISVVCVAVMLERAHFAFAQLACPCRGTDQPGFNVDLGFSEYSGPSGCPRDAFDRARDRWLEEKVRPGYDRNAPDNRNDFIGSVVNFAEAHNISVDAMFCTDIKVVVGGGYCIGTGGAWSVEGSIGPGSISFEGKPNELNKFCVKVATQSGAGPLVSIGAGLCVDKTRTLSVAIDVGSGYGVADPLLLEASKEFQLSVAMPLMEFFSGVKSFSRDTPRDILGGPTPSDLGSDTAAATAF